MDPSWLFLLPLFLHTRTWRLFCHIRDNGRFYKHSSIQTLCSQCCLVKYRKSTVRRLLHTYLFKYLFVVQSGDIFNMFLPNIFLKYFHELEKTISSKLKVKWSPNWTRRDNYVSKNWDCKKDRVNNSSSFGKDGRMEYFISIIII